MPELLSHEIQRRYKSFCKLFVAPKKLIQVKHERTLRWMENLAEDIFDDYFLALPRGRSIQKMMKFPKFVYMHLEKEFSQYTDSSFARCLEKLSFEERISHICTDLVLLIESVKDKRPGVYLFSLFLTEKFDQKDLFYFLYTRSAIEHVKSLLPERVESLMIHDLKLSMNDVRKSMKLVHNSDDDDVAEAILSKCQTEFNYSSTNQITSMSFLKIAVGTYHQLKSRLVSKRRNLTFDESQPREVEVSKDHATVDSSSNDMSLTWQDDSSSAYDSRVEPEMVLKKQIQPKEGLNDSRRSNLSSNKDLSYSSIWNAPSVRERSKSNKPQRKAREKSLKSIKRQPHNPQRRKRDVNFMKLQKTLIDRPQIEVYVPKYPSKVAPSPPVEIQRPVVKSNIKNKEGKKSEWLDAERNSTDSDEIYYRNQSSTHKATKWERTNLKTDLGESDVGSFSEENSVVVENKLQELSVSDESDYAEVRIMKSSTEVSQQVVASLKDTVPRVISRCLREIMGRATLEAMDFPFEVVSTMEKEMESRLSDKIWKVVNYTAGIQRGSIHSHERICSPKSLPETCFINDVRGRFRAVIREAFERNEVDYFVERKMREYVEYIAYSHEIRREIEPLYSLLLSYATANIYY